MIIIVIVIVIVIIVTVTKPTPGRHSLKLTRLQLIIFRLWSLLTLVQLALVELKFHLSNQLSRNQDNIGYYHHNLLVNVRGGLSTCCGFIFLRL